MEGRWKATIDPILIRFDDPLDSAVLLAYFLPYFSVCVFIYNDSDKKQ